MRCSCTHVDYNNFNKSFIIINVTGFKMETKNSSGLQLHVRTQLFIGPELNNDENLFAGKL